MTVIAGEGIPLPRRVNPENLNAFGEVFWKIAQRRGIEKNQRAVTRYMAERGQEIPQQYISRWTTKGAQSNRPTPRLARRLVEGLELDVAEQIELAWADMYGERMPQELVERLEAFSKDRNADGS
jgi:hypothetical protein